MRFEQGGAGFTPPIDNPVLLSSASVLNLNNFFFYQSPILDMRAFQSYGLRVKLEDGTMTARDITNLEVEFFMEPSGVNRNFRDDFFMYKTNVLNSTPFFLTDVCHGSWMRLSFLDSFSVNRTVDLTYELFGSYRPTANTFLRTSVYGLVLHTGSDSLAGGANSGGKLGALAYGPAQLTLKSGAGGGATMDVMYGEDTTLIDQLKTTTANTLVSKLAVLPRQQMRVIITNDGAGASVIKSNITQQLQPF